MCATCQYTKPLTALTSSWWFLACTSKMTTYIHKMKDNFRILHIYRQRIKFYLHFTLSCRSGSRNASIIIGIYNVNNELSSLSLYCYHTHILKYPVTKSVERDMHQIFFLCFNEKSLQMLLYFRTLILRMLCEIRRSVESLMWPILLYGRYGHYLLPTIIKQIFQKDVFNSIWRRSKFPNLILISEIFAVV